MRTHRSGESALLLIDVVDVLTPGGISYAVIGALAAPVHGAVRASLDADAMLSVSPLEARRIQQLLEAAGFQVELNRGDADDPIAVMLRVSDRQGNRVNLLIGLRGMEPDAFARTVAIPFQGSELRFVGLEDFIAMKAIAGGPVDILDATCARDAAGEALDRTLLRQIAVGYGREAAAAVETLLGGIRS